MYDSSMGVLERSVRYYHTPSNMAHEMFFYTLCIGHYYCSSDYKVERESYKSFLLMYVKKGEGTVVIENRKYSVKEKDVILLDCYKPHCYFTNTGWEILWLHFDGNSSRSFYNSIVENNGSIVCPSNSIIIPKYLQSILKNFTGEELMQEALISCHIQRMLAELLMMSSTNKVMPNNSVIMDSIAYIESHFPRKLTLEEIAKEAGVSHFHFSRIFKKETGYSPYEYILKTRLSFAKKLLKETNKTVKQVAFECGFNSEANFIFMFHKHVDMTPGEFRNLSL
jgi:AraC family transcriptional regulator